MFFITGDTHGEYARFLKGCIPFIETMNNRDYLFISGDFGFVSKSNKEKIMILDELEKLPFTLLFVDGNHEHFHDLNSFDIEEYCGGKIHRIRKNIIHLMRSQVYTIEGKTIFTMGGGYSLDEKQRIEGLDYFKEEMPSDEEYDEALLNLKKHNNKVDYIISHSANERTIWYMKSPHRKELQLNSFLQYIEETVTYKHWYFGHFHLDKDLTDKQTVLWFDIRDIETNKSVL